MKTVCIEQFEIRGWRDVSAWSVTPALLATRCYKGNSSSSQPTTTAEGEGVNATNSTVAKEGSLAVGSGSKYLETGSTDLTGFTLNQNKTDSDNVDIGKYIAPDATDLAGSTITVTDNGAVQSATDLASHVTDTQAAGFQAALNSIAGLAEAGGAQLGDILDKANQSQSQAFQTVNSTVTGLIDELQQLNSTAQAGAADQPNKIILYLGGGVLLVVIIAVWMFGKKK